VLPEVVPGCLLELGFEDDQAVTFFLHMRKLGPRRRFGDLPEAEVGSLGCHLLGLALSSKIKEPPYVALCLPLPTWPL
jgi:hypothetical protein